MTEGGGYVWQLTSLAIGPQGREEFELKEGENPIGRSNENIISIRSVEVSRKQCVIYFIGQTLTLIDVGSTNGTFINGQRIDPNVPVTLFENDTIGFGVCTSTQETYNVDTAFLVYRLIRRLSFKDIEKLALQKREQPPKRKPDGNQGSPDSKKAKTSNCEALTIRTAPATNDSILVSSKKGSFTTFHAVNGSSDVQVIEERSTLHNSLGAANSSWQAETKRQTRSSVQPVPSTSSKDTDEPPGRRDRVQRLPEKADPKSAVQPTSANDMDEPMRRRNPVQRLPENPTPKSAVTSTVDILDDPEPTRKLNNVRQVPEKAAPKLSAPSATAKNDIPGPARELNPAPALQPVSLSYKSPIETDMPTFSLLSDDEDDDFVSSQMFIKCDTPPKAFQRPGTSTSREPETECTTDPGIISDDEDFEDLFDSDDDSFFERHVSQAIDDAILDDSPSKGLRERGKAGEIPSSLSRGHVSKKMPSPELSSDDSDEPEVIIPRNKLTKSLDPPANAAPRVTREASSEPSSKKHHEDLPSSARSAGRKSTSKNLESLVKKMKTSSNQQSKKTLLTEPQSLAGNHASQRILRTASKLPDPPKLPEPKLPELPSKTARRESKSAKLQSKTADKPTTNGAKKKRVAFCEESLAKIQEFEVSKEMKKLPPIPHKEPRIVTPAFQLTGYSIGTSNLTKIICDWNMSWFEEMLKVQTDPPLATFKPHVIGDKFSNFDQYYCAMMASTAHEAWSELQRLHIEQNDSQSFQILAGDIMHVEENKNEHTVFASCKISARPDDVMPSFGDIVGVLVLKSDKNLTELYNSFGVIVKQFPTMKINCKEGKKIIGGADIVFRVSRRHAVNAENCIIRIRVYKSGLNWFRYQTAIKNVSTSPLKSVILDPATAPKVVAKTKGPTSLLTGILQTPLNDLQANAVHGISSSILKNESSISLIHGPPGTGKSTAITALVLQLLDQFRNSRNRDPPKILLCAPSNAAIDEVVLKLLEIRKRMPKDKKFKLTRVGVVKKMHPLVAEVSSQSLAKRTVSSTTVLTKDDLETEIKLAQARLTSIDNCQGKKANKKYEAERTRIETRIAHFQKCMANINAGKKAVNPEENWKLLKESECSVIGGAEIIATTLSSSVSKTLSSGLGICQIGCCIVDEATQATEPEVLLPILHNVKHFALVGDPQQLGPTVQSKYAKSQNFEYSLFHRLMSEWDRTKNPNLYPLRVQYRMHEEIVSFPSEKFYKSQLMTPEYLRVNYRFSPYQVISHSWPENSDEESNLKEARCIVDLAQKICSSDLFAKMSVGVIVPYQQQRSLIAKIINDRKDKTLDVVVVNTIDSFQGQEKDVVILSCVRTKRVGFLCDKQRLNVALTRAKKCLMVVGNFHCLKNEDIWKSMIDDAVKRGRLIRANPNERIAPKIIFSSIISRHKPQPQTIDRKR